MAVVRICAGKFFGMLGLKLLVSLFSDGDDDFVETAKEMSPRDWMSTSLMLMLLFFVLFNVVYDSYGVGNVT